LDAASNPLAATYLTTAGPRGGELTTRSDLPFTEESPLAGHPVVTAATGSCPETVT
jgi:hypothetical protein